ncbi:MAG: CARDB domain-containing protein, partial [Candidatus Hodarchaeales archaeon]
GVLGLAVSIKNVGDETTTDLDWSISVNGGMFDTIDISLENSIPSLEQGETISKRVPRFGFGIVDIMVTVDPSNAGMASKRTNALLFGLLLIPFK